MQGTFLLFLITTTVTAVKGSSYSIKSRSDTSDDSWTSEYFDMCCSNFTAVDTPILIAEDDHTVMFFCRDKDEICSFGSCQDFYNVNSGYIDSGVYKIKPDEHNEFEVYCDMTTDGGGWTVIQRRKDGSVDFYRNWVDYANGFGDLLGEFWLGLEKIHQLTNAGVKMQLRVDLEDQDGVTGYAKYSSFSVSNASDLYRLEVAGYDGTVGDSLSHHSNRLFTTKDRDNDEKAGVNNAIEFQGAWWYHDSHHSNLNGQYNSSVPGQGINWGFWRKYDHSLPFCEMKIRPHSQ